MNEHSVRYNAIPKIEEVVDDGANRYLLEELNLSETRFKRIAEAFLKKLKTADNGVGLTETEERIDEYLRERRYYNDYGYDYNKYCETAFGYEVSYFPLNMIEGDIIDAIQEAYRNASKRSKRIFPGAQTIG